MKNGWIGVDFDGTLSRDIERPEDYDPATVGPPIKPMVKRVKQWLKQGIKVKIFTGRVADDPEGIAKKAIQEWCKKHLGQVLPVTNIKDHKMFLLYDDRAVTVEKDIGKLLVPKKKIRKHEKE